MKREFTFCTAENIFKKSTLKHSGLAIRKLVMFASSLLLLSAMASCDGVNSCVKGDGKYSAEIRVLEGEFSGIEMASSFQVIARKDSVYSIEVEADSNLLPFIITRVRSGLLLIDNERRCFRSKNPVKINITAPDIERVLLDGSGSVEVDSMDAKMADIELNGSGDILVSVLFADDANIIIDGSGGLRIDQATANSFNVNHGGSGYVELNDIQSGYLDFGLDGSGSIEAYKIITDHVRASIQGSGYINLHGEKAVVSDLKIGGSGSINSYGLYQDFCDVYISGSGKVFTYVVKELKVDIPGSGYVYYKGSPEVALVIGTLREQVIEDR